MLTEEERAQALYELSFNWSKACKLFFLCLASCLLGLSVLYWTLDYQSKERTTKLQAQLVADMDAIASFYHYEPLADLYEGVVGFRGKVDFDQVTYLGVQMERYHHEVKLTEVKGQKRVVGTGVYELRFVPKNAEPQAEVESKQEKATESASS
ncbi:MAG: hypothetical protein ROM54_10060 [Anaerobiospirillum sp.]|nr:hypothetical protein [Anaerobiospirillum sp.]